MDVVGLAVELHLHVDHVHVMVHHAKARFAHLFGVNDADEMDEWEVAVA